MEIILTRKVFTEEATFGEIRIGDDIWYSLEDHDRGLDDTMSLDQIASLKEYGKTCIPYGTYKVVITQSARFTKMKRKPVFTPQLLNVKGFDGIRIHPANFASQLEGCIAPGLKFDEVLGMMKNSRDAYNEILSHINVAVKQGELVTITINKG